MSEDEIKAVLFDFPEQDEEIDTAGKAQVSEIYEVLLQTKCRES